MAGGQAGGKNGVTIVVAGDRGTGKSSLTLTAVSEISPGSVPPVPPPSPLPDDMYPDCVPITIIDTSSSPENRNKLAEELKRADVVVLTYACDQLGTLDRLSTFWLPELRRLEVRVPVIVVGCKLDLRDERQQGSLEQVMSPIMQQFWEIETWIECSAFKHILVKLNPCHPAVQYQNQSRRKVSEVFYYAQKAVLYPTAPLFDQEEKTLRPGCKGALTRIFVLCDHDRDGALSDAELNDFQVKCFNAPLQPAEIAGVKRIFLEYFSLGTEERDLPLPGFLFLHASSIEKGRPEITWTVLRKFGYNDDIRLTDDLLPPAFKRAPDQSVELTGIAIEFLERTFTSYDRNNHGALHPWILDDNLFSTAPESPWSEAPYKDTSATTALGDLPLEGFISKWALMTHLDPAKSVEYLKYVMYDGDAASALRLTRKRRIDRKEQKTDRTVFHCFVFGPKKAGKSALLNAFLGRPFSEKYVPTTEEQYAVGFVYGPTGAKNILILREIPEDSILKLLSSKDSLASCDVAIFVCDSSDEMSWKKASELLVDVAGHGEDTGYEMPCLIVAAKDDLEAYPLFFADSTRVSQDMGIDAPIPISVRDDDLNNIFRRIVCAAEHPHLSIPEAEAGRSRKHYHRLVNRSLMVVSVGAAVAIVGLVAYRVYAARKNTSS